MRLNVTKIKQEHPAEWLKLIEGTSNIPTISADSLKQRHN